MKKALILAIITLFSALLTVEPALAIVVIGNTPSAHRATTLKIVKKPSVKKKIIRRKAKKKATAKKSHPMPIIAGPLNQPAPPPLPAAPPATKKYPDVIIHDQPITLSGFDVLEIKNTHYILKGNITLKDHAQLIIRNAWFEQRNPGDTPVTLEADNQSRVTIANSDVQYSPHINWTITDESALNLENVKVIYNTATDWNVWHLVSKRAQISVKNASFSGSLSDEIRLDAADSPEMYLDITLPHSVIVDNTFPAKAVDFAFPGMNDHNINMRVKLTNSNVTRWGLVLSPFDDVRVKNSGPMNFGFIIGWPYQTESVALDNLRNQLYDKREVDVKDTRLRLENTAVSNWTLLVGENNTLNVTNSDIGEEVWSWGHAKITLDNSTSPAVRARENVDITLRNSTVSGDVSVTDFGTITIISSTYKGRKNIAGNGRFIE